MVRVHLTNGELTAWWLNEDKPVAKLKGSWHGPIPASTGPPSRSSLVEHVTNLPRRCESALAGALDAVQPIEEPQSRRDVRITDDLAERSTIGRPAADQRPSA